MRKIWVFQPAGCIIMHFDKPDATFPRLLTQHTLKHEY